MKLYSFKGWWLIEKNNHLPDVTVGSTNTVLSFKEQRILCWRCNGAQRNPKSFSPLIIVPAVPLIGMLKRMHIYNVS